MVNLQVKTSYKKVSSWIVGKNYKQWHGDYNYYVFVRYYNEKYEAFLESSENVIKQVNNNVEQLKKRGLKDWLCWRLPRKSSPIQKVQWRMFSRFKHLKS